eukprot:TRINITY_DN2649_c0_g1_i1.p1 TRINITY_DN2649_c0_g1~~TRINITY_DN2649_c0_g1_i1.p1  ORF type:complete len:726 (-),score=113.10 TRINITY_DN2649_c0_g1_i1:41-2218(-)
MKRGVLIKKGGLLLWNKSIHTHHRNNTTRLVFDHNTPALSLCSSHPRLFFRDYSTSSSQHIKQDEKSVFGFEGFEPLTNPNDWKEVSKKAVFKARNIVNTLTRNVENISIANSSVVLKVVDKDNHNLELDVLALIDLISSCLCEVGDAGVFCKNVHSKQEWIESGMKASNTVNQFMYSLNTYKPLYQLFEKIIADPNYHTLPKESQHLVQELTRDIGVAMHMSDQQRKLYESLKMEENSLSEIYMQQSTNPPAVMENLEKGKKSKKMVPLTLSMTNLVLQTNEDPTAREKAYKSRFMEGQETVETLESLLEARYQIAKITGFESYADLVLRSTLAKTTSNVNSLLNQLAPHFMRKAQQETALLASEKKKHEPEDVLFPWDEQFYIEKVRQSSHIIKGEVVKDYFSISNCLEGVNILVNSLYGLETKEVPLETNERWADNMKKIKVFHPTEGVYGYIYLDLLERRGKSNMFATLMLRYGSRNFESSSPSGCLPFSSHHIPAVALYCSFPSTQLTFDEAEIFFHEMGHALHCILCRNEYQFLSGNRGPLDHVEIPSTLFERFISDPRITPLFAKHRTSGKSLPVELIDSFTKKKRMFSGLTNLGLVFYSFVDQEYHSNQSMLGKTSKVWFDLQKKYSTIPSVEGTLPQAYFMHFSTYAATFYSYLYSKIYAAHIWKKHFEYSPLSREAGERYRRGFLQHGYAIDPKELLDTYLGEGINIRYFLDDQI